MREATGNSLLTMIMTSVVAIIMIFFVGTLSYSKSYKIKNYIVNAIEDNRGWDDNLQVEVDNYMKDAGYNLRRSSSNCPQTNCTYINNTSNYEYCVYRCSSGVNEYYKVITYMKFDFPVIGDFVKFPVQGETKTLNSR